MMATTEDIQNFEKKAVDVKALKAVPRRVTDDRYGAKPENVYCRR